MDYETAQSWWNKLNDLYATDKQAYHKFVQKHMEKLHNTKAVRPKFGFCVSTDAEKIFLKTKFNEYTEKISKYFVYVYYTDKMKASAIPEEALKNAEALNFHDIHISVSKIKGESDKHLYAEAVIHTDLYKQICKNSSLKNKIVTKILEIVNKHEMALSSDIIINPQKYSYVDILHPPKTYHYLNPECVDDTHDKDNNVEITNQDEQHYYGVPTKEKLWKWESEILRKTEQEKKQETEMEDKELKLYNCCPGVVSDLQSVKSIKKKEEKNTKSHVPKQVQSYFYKILMGFLHIVLTFKDLTDDDLEIIKKGNNVSIFVSKKSDESMSLNFNENLSDNVKAYFNEKLHRLIISIELL